MKSKSFTFAHIVLGLALCFPAAVIAQQSSNTAIGVNALYSNTTGNANTATGYGALFSNTTGNVNTASGYGALYYNTTGNGNVAHGFYSLYSNTTGVNNTASGYGTLFFNNAGSYNTALGLNAGPDQNSPNLTNATAIGANAIVSRSNALVLGGTGGWSVNVGIGTATPSTALDVVGNLRLEGSGNGITFPDGTSQTTASAMGPKGAPGPAGPPGPQGPAGPPVHTSAMCLSNVSLGLVGSPCNKTAAFKSVPGGACNVTADTGSCSASSSASTFGQTAAVCAVCIP
jgi:hypothetical protein